MKRKSISNRITSLAMAAVMTIGNLNLPAMTVHAEPEWTKSIENTGLGTGSIGDPKAPDSKDDPWTGSYVYYGTYGNQAAPVKYRVLDSETGIFGGKTMLLDCDTYLFDNAFRANNADNANVWSASDIYTVLNGDDNGSFLNSSFSGAERRAIAESSAETHETTVGSPLKSIVKQYTALDKDRIFLLDFEDVLNPDYGYSNDCGNQYSVFNHRKSGTYNGWWLRSATSFDDTKCAGIVDSAGRTFYAYSFNKYGVSPAFNVNLSSVIFASEIKSGAEAENYGAEYKLTVLDDNLLIEAGDVLRNGNVVTVPYTITDNSEAVPDRVSVAVVTNGSWTGTGWSDGAVLQQYEELNVEDFANTGTGTFTLDTDKLTGVWGQDYHVYILAEDINDDAKGTDYASSPVEIKAYVSIEGYEGMYDGQAHGISVTVDDSTAGTEIRYGLTEGNYDRDESPVITDANESALTVYYQITATGYPAKTGSADIKITPKEVGLDWSDTVLSYTGKAQKPTATASGLVNGDSCIVTVTGEQTDAGTYTATASGISNGNYKLPADPATQFTIAKAETTVIAPVAKEGLKAADASQALVSAGKAEGGEMLYALGADDKTAPTEGWSKDVPMAKDAGTYYVWYKAVGDKNHKDTEPACVKVVIAEKAQEEKPEDVIADPVSEKQEKVSESVKETINDVPVSANLAVSYPKAVEWTGKKVTKAQLEALLSDGETLAKLNISGLEEALKGKMKEGTDVSKLFSYGLSISKDKDAGTTGYFTVKIKLNSKAFKKAKIKGADKKALTKLVKELNDKLKDTKFEYKIAPLKLAEAESVTIKAKLKKGALQQDEQGNLTGLKSIKVKIKIKGVKKAKTFTYSAKKAAKLFKIKITDVSAKTADLTALEGTSFTGTKSGITIK